MGSSYIWLFTANSQFTTQPVLRGDILVCSTSDSLHGINLYSGEEQWKYKLSTNGIRSPIVACGNSVFFLGNPIDFDPTVSSRSDVIDKPSSTKNSSSDNDLTGGGGDDLTGGGGDDLTGGGDSTSGRISLIVLDIGTGIYQPHWLDIVKDLADLLDPLVEANNLILRDSVGKLYGYNTRSEINIKSLWQLNLSETLTHGSFTPGAAGLGDDAVFFVIGSNLVGINVKSGQVRWQFSPPKDDVLPQTSPPLVGNGMVITAGSKAVHALDWRTGVELWTHPIESEHPWNTPVVSWEGECLIGTTLTGKVYGLVLATGDVFWQSDLAQLLGVAHETEQSGGFLQPIINSDVVVMDAESGRLFTEDRVFLPASSGAVCVVELQVNKSGASSTAHESSLLVNDKYQQRYQLCLQNVIAAPNGLSFIPLIGNGTILLPDSQGGVTAHSISEQVAAYFNGKNSRILLPPKKEYDFGRDDFSLEVWIRTTIGGDVISQSPTVEGGSGFRLTIANQPDNILSKTHGEGCVQFTVSDSNGYVLQFTQTQPAGVADGFWHHISLIRSGTNISILIDGISQPINTVVSQSLIPPVERAQLSSHLQYFSPSRLSENLIIPEVGNSAESIVIGSYAPSSDLFSEDHAYDFQGLIADVRVWQVKLTAKQVINRMTKLLTGQEPGLITVYLLNQPSPNEFKDLRDDAALDSTQVPNVQARLTNLVLDESLYPYLLNHVEVQWPNSERWTVRGEDAPKGSPSGIGEIVCFVTDRALYAIDLIHGSRKWSWDLNQPSVPVVDSYGCYVLDEMTVRSFHPDMGVQQWFANLADLLPQFKDQTASSPTLAVTKNCVVASADGHHFYWLEKRTGNPLGYFTFPDAICGQCLVRDEKLYAIAGSTLYYFTEPAATNASAQEIVAIKTTALTVQGHTSTMCLDGKRLFVYNGADVRVLDSQTLQPPPNFAWNPTELKEETVTGMVASANLNRLILSTNKGKILFWEYSSGKLVNSFTIPDLTAPFVYAPVIYGQNVFCTAYATDGSYKGGLWTLDLKTGDLRGCDRVSSSPTGSPYIAVNTAFFGCDDEGHGGKRDAEALHSVIVGSTLALKRDANNPEISVPVDPIFARQEVTGQNAFNEGNFTLEVWVNSETGAGGEILCLPPGKVGDNLFAGFRLAINAQGVIVAEHLKLNAGSRFSSQATTILNGYWHHVAAVFKYNSEKSQQLCHLYLDGQPLSGVRYVALDKVPQPIEERGVLIGGSAGLMFQGMLTDVRIWETWLHRAEIDSRRNTKLLGIEPDLLAAWTFSADAVHDASSNQLSHYEVRDLNLWLTELSFVAPSYPYLTASSQGVETVTKTLANGNGQTITTARYKTQIATRSADGSPRGNTHVKVWASEDTTITVNNPPESKQINATNFAELLTDVHGNLELNLSCNDLDHSPVLWIWADFMFKNERFYVSPVVESQRHVVEPPPRLVAQSSMVQDYSYSPGDKLGENASKGSFTANDNVDVTTIRTIIKAENNDGGVIPNEALEIWADDHLTIQVAGKDYPINSENSARFKTGADGSITIVIHEESNLHGNLLSIPSLQIRAGFMSRTQRFVVNPSENAHKALSEVNGNQITGDHPLSPGESQRPLIKTLVDNNKDKARQQAPAIASTLNQMASLTKKHEPARTGAAGATSELNKPASGAESPNPDLKPPDWISAVHSSSYVAYSAPITPEYMPAKHFVFSINDDGSLSHKLCQTEADLDDHLQTLGLGSSTELFHTQSPTSNDPAGSFLSCIAAIGEAIDYVKHGIENAVSEAKHFVVKTWDEVKDDVGEVIHQVEVVVADAAKAIGKWVVKTVKDVVDHVTAFLQKVWTVLKDIYNFLRALFDWKGILEVHDVIRDMFNTNLQALDMWLKDSISSEIKTWFSGVKEALAEDLGAVYNDPNLSGSLNSQRDKASGVSSQCASQAQSGKSQWMKGKLNDHATSEHESLLDPFGGIGTLTKPFGDSGLSNLNQGFAKLIDDVSGILHQSGGITHLTIQEVMQLLDDVINLVIDVIEDVLLDTVKLVSFAVEQIFNSLNHELDIPFISDLYELITGDALTILDVIALIIAIPVHTILVIFDIEWNKSSIQALVAKPAFSSTEAEAAGMAAGNTGLKALDSFYLVFVVAKGIFGGVNDYAQGEENLATPPGLIGPAPKESLAKMILGAVSSFTSIGASLFQWSVRNEVADIWSGEWKKTTITYLKIVSPTIQMALIIYSIVNRNSGNVAASFGRASVDKWGVRIKNVPTAWINSLLGLGSLALSIYSLVEHKPGDKVTDGINFTSDNVMGEEIIDLLEAIAGSFQFLDSSDLCKATDVDGIPISALALAAIDVILYSFAVPVTHTAKGFGKAIL